MSDIVFDGLVFDRLRQIGDQSNRIAALESEVARLRLTDAEREAIQFALRRLYGTLRGNEECDHADALQGILERIA